MADAGDALALKCRRGGEQRARRREDDAVPFALAHPAQQIPAQNACRAAATAAAAVHVLRFDVVEQKPAVGVALTERESIAREKVRDDLMPEPAEVARHDEVIVFGFCPRVAKERAQRVIGGGGHRRAHVVCVGDALVDDFPGCHVCDIGPLALAREEAATAACGRPLRGRRALRAVGHRHAVLPLGGAEVRGGQRRGARGIPAVEHQCGERQALAHRGARTVESIEWDAALSQSERRADALVQKITRKDEVKVTHLEPHLFQRAGERVALHGTLTLFPGLLAEEVILAQFVKVFAQRAFALEPPADGGEREDGGTCAQAARLRADGFLLHHALPFPMDLGESFKSGISFCRFSKNMST